MTSAQVRKAARHEATLLIAGAQERSVKAIALWHELTDAEPIDGLGWLQIEALLFALIYADKMRSTIRETA